MICVAPIVGKGTMDDRRRPQYAPFTHQNSPTTTAPSRSGIISFTHVASDDGKLALVEFVAADRTALLPILNDKTIISFEKGKHSKSEIETEIRKYCKSFVLENFGAPTL